MADGGRRKKEGKPRNGGALGVFVGQRAPGRVEWRLGEADSVRGGSTVDGRSGQRRCAWRGVVSARESAWDTCERGKVPRGKPGGAGGLPGSIWPQTRRGRGPPAVYGGRNRGTGMREMEVRAYLRFLKFQGPLGNLNISPI